MDVEVIRRICLSRHLFELGQSCLKSSNDLFLFSAANLIQDAIESFLLAVADHLDAGIDQHTNFDKYFVLINNKIAPKELPFKNKLLRLNKIRVSSKHYGIQPARDECIRLSVCVREFFEEVSSSILEINFSTVSTIDLLEDGEVKELLIAAKINLENADFVECAISCRKAIYLELEKEYNISHVIDDTQPNVLLVLCCRSPYITQNKDYIDKHVKEPTDFIVYDHSNLDQELLKYGIDNTSFWNVCRLTPEVFRKKDGDWIIKHDFNKLEPKILKDKIEYIFTTTVDIIFSIHSKKDQIKTSESRLYSLELKQEEVPVYEKADIGSNVLATTPPGLTKIYSQYRIMGLSDDGPYWYVFHLEKELLIIGFIHNDYVK